jgi:NAD(P)-dependent dehydrogenase (short-subunit alcohol dehydrogenase family)
MHNLLTEMFSLKGRVAVVTGGAVNLGLDAARVLAAAGADIVLTSRSEARAVTAANNLEQEFGIKALGIAMDQSSHTDIARAARQGLSWSAGRLDILVNNAGGGSGASVARLFERAPEDIDAMLNTNLAGVVHCCRCFGPAMARDANVRGSASIINIASVAAIVGRDRRVYAAHDLNGQPVDYAAAKAGILGLTRDLAAYAGPMGIRVNAISPGGFARPDMKPGFVQDYSERTVLGRMGEDGRDLNGAILFLASSASDYVTGQNIVVDGGFTIQR